MSEILRTQLAEIPIRMAAPERVVLTVLAHLKNGQIDDATAGFAEEFSFNDYGIGLEFKDREGLAEFFQKTRQLYPDSSLQTDTIFVSGDHVITQWTLRATLAGSFYAGLSRKVPVLVHGTSIVRIDHGKITDWSDYYDGLTSRRTALASYFTTWVEL
jgi:hypothetical protein